jgi:hypothetical protein
MAKFYLTIESQPRAASLGGGVAVDSRSAPVSR